MRVYVCVCVCCSCVCVCAHGQKSCASDRVWKMERSESARCVFSKNRKHDKRSSELCSMRTICTGGEIFSRHSPNTERRSNVNKTLYELNIHISNVCHAEPNAERKKRRPNRRVLISCMHGCFFLPLASTIYICILHLNLTDSFVHIGDIQLLRLLFHTHQLSKNYKIVHTMCGIWFLFFVIFVVWGVFVCAACLCSFAVPFSVLTNDTEIQSAN